MTFTAKAFIVKNLKKITLALSVSTFLLTGSAYAIPYLDKDKITQARKNLDLEKMRADAKANPKANDIASFCMRMTKFRLGSSYKLEVTDKRVPEKQAIAGSYTIVGTAKKEDETLSFVCKADYDAKNHTTLKELKLYQVKAIPQKSSKQ